MAKIDSGSKSSRLLASRRYTHDTFTTAQESFTNVLDLRSEEIYTQAGSIPSSGLPFSGSSQSGSYYQVGGENILRYWYRHRLTKSSTNNETWFFLSPPAANVGAQLISDDQVTNFISPKYSVSSLANANTEDGTPGYGVKLILSTASDSSSIDLTSNASLISGNDFIFDYKTGIVQFMNSSVDPTDSQYVYMTAYQYVGKTLATGLELTGNVSSSGTSTGSFGDLQVGAAGSQLFSKFSASIQSRVGASEAGNITAVNAGTGLSGGGSSGDVTVNIDFTDSDLQSGISGSLGSNATLIRSLTATGISGSFGGQRVGTSNNVTFAGLTSTGVTTIGTNVNSKHKVTGSLNISSSFTGHTGFASGALVIDAPGTESVGIVLKSPTGNSSLESPYIKWVRDDGDEATLRYVNGGLETSQFKVSNNVTLGGRFQTSDTSGFALSYTGISNTGVGFNSQGDISLRVGNFTPLIVSSSNVIMITGSISSSADMTASFGELIVGGTGNSQNYSDFSASISTRAEESEAGNITSVTAGTGLSGGGSSGGVTLNVDFSDSTFAAGISGSFGRALNNNDEVIMNRGGELSSSAALKVVTDGYGTHTLATDLKSGGSFRIFPKNSNVYIGSGNIGATGGDRNVGLGSGALYNNNNNDNVGVGNSTLNANTTGWENTAVGSQAGTANITGDNSIWMGYRAGYVMTAGSFNTILGTLSANALAGQVSYNTLVGGNIGQTTTAANKFTSGSYNTYLGYGIRSSGRNSSVVRNEIVIGAGVQGRGSNTVTIGATPRSLTDNSALTHGESGNALGAVTDYYMSGSGTAVMHIGSLNAHSHITSSGNISGSGTSTGSFGRIEATTISGDGSGLTNVFEGTTPSSSLSTRVTNLKTDSGSFSTRVTNLKTDSGSFSTRTTNLKTDSGSFSTRTTNLKTDSGSISTRLQAVEQNAGGQSLTSTSTPTFASLTLTGDLTAKNYIVSSSVTHLTRSFSSGSSIFGNSFDDTHQFTGSLFISSSINRITGSLSVSESITAKSFTGDGSGLTNVFEGTTPSSSLSTRVTNLKTDSGSVSTRVTTLESSDGSSLTISGISGSLGSNATLIRTLTAAGITGSFTPISQSLQTRVGTLEDETGGIFIATGSVQATTNNLQVTGSVTATSFVGDGSNLTGLVTANSVQFSAFDSDSNGDLMPTAENVFSRILYELDDNNDLMPI